jgi:hypothetical protein
LYGHDNTAGRVAGCSRAPRRVNGCSRPDLSLRPRLLAVRASCGRVAGWSAMEMLARTLDIPTRVSLPRQRSGSVPDPCVLAPPSSDATPECPRSRMQAGSDQGKTRVQAGRAEKPVECRAIALVFLSPVQRGRQNFTSKSTPSFCSVLSSTRWVVRRKRTLNYTPPRRTR